MGQRSEHIEAELLAAIGRGSGRGQGAEAREHPPKWGTGEKANGKGNGKGAKPPEPDPKQGPQGARDMSRTRCFNCDELGHIGRHCPKPDRRKLRPQRTAKALKGLNRLCFMQHKRIIFDNLNQFQALAEDRHELEHFDSTENEGPGISEFPVVADIPEVKTEKMRMPELSRKTQKERRREMKEIDNAARYIMSKNKPLRDTAESTCPPPPAPSGDARPPKQSTRGTKFAPKADCECCDGTHVSRPYASWGDYHAERGDYFEARRNGWKPPLESDNLTTVGSSGDLPLAADEPGNADYNHEDDPRVGTGETHQAAADGELNHVDDSYPFDYPRDS